jgi:hypothetical protein
MKKIIMLAAVLSVLLTTTAHAQNAACSTVITLPNSKFIYKNSAPVRGGPNAVIIGFRVEPTLIMTTSAFSSRSSTKIYDSAGNHIGSCPWASAHGFAGGRFRCTMNTRNLRRAAINNTKSPAVFIRYKGTACAKIPDAGRCYGSVKGPCDRILG